MLYRQSRWLGMFIAAGALLAPAWATEPLGPDAVRARLAKAGDAAKHDADVVVVFDHTEVRVHPDGIGTAHHHRLVKILREAGIRGQAVQVFPFDPYTNRLELETVRVWRADGSTVDVPLDIAVKEPQPASGIFWPTAQLMVTLPRLAVGDAVETASSMTGFNVAYLGAGADGHANGSAAGNAGATGELNARGEPLVPPVPGNWHDEVHFWSSVPVLEQRYAVRVPRDKPLQFEVYNGDLRPAVTFDADEIVYAFEMKDIRPLKSETRQEPWPNVAPKLLLATLPTWEDKSRWLYGVSEPQFEADDAIRAKVAEIIRDCRTDEEKYTALNHWVAENIRYAGTSRGMCEGYTVHRGIETFHDRCGVCKDKAGMLVTMLRVAGYNSFLVMTMARQRVDRIPADQFNHAVTCIRWPDGRLQLLDPTWMPRSRDNWSTFEPLQHVVYGVPDGVGLSQSPDFPPEVNVASWQGESAISPQGDLTGDLHFNAAGAPETRLRRALAGMPANERGAWFDEAAMRLASNARLEKVECLDPVNFSGPMKIAGQYRAASYALGAGPRRYLALPMMQTIFGHRTLYDLLDDTLADQRKYGITLQATRLVQIAETLTLPAGWHVVTPPAEVKLDGPSAALHFAATVDGQKLQYTCELRIKRWTIPPEEYANYKEVIEQFKKLTGRIITCTVEDAHGTH